MRRADGWAQWVAQAAPWGAFGGLTFDPARYHGLPDQRAADGRLWARRREALPEVPYGFSAGLPNGKPVPMGSRSSATRMPTRVVEWGRETTLEASKMPVDVAVGRVRRWLRSGEETLRRPLTAVVAFESHANGWPHAHPLVAAEGGMTQEDRDVLARLWRARNGIEKLREPRSVGDCAAYATKYLVKEIDDGGVLIWPEKGPLKSAMRAVQSTLGARGR